MTSHHYFECVAKTNFHHTFSGPANFGVGEAGRGPRREEGGAQGGGSQDSAAEGMNFSPMPMPSAHGILSFPFSRKTSYPNSVETFMFSDWPMSASRGIRRDN